MPNPGRQVQVIDQGQLEHRTESMVISLNTDSYFPMQVRAWIDLHSSLSGAILVASQSFLQYRRIQDPRYQSTESLIIIVISYRRRKMTEPREVCRHSRPRCCGVRPSPLFAVPHDESGPSAQSGLVCGTLDQTFVGPLLHTPYFIDSRAEASETGVGSHANGACEKENIDLGKEQGVGVMCSVLRRDEDRVTDRCTCTVHSKGGKE